MKGADFFQASYSTLLNMFAHSTDSNFCIGGFYAGRSANDVIICKCNWHFSVSLSFSHCGLWLIIGFTISNYWALSSGSFNLSFRSNFNYWTSSTNFTFAAYTVFFESARFFWVASLRSSISYSYWWQSYSKFSSSF